jgi:hypothetical protein
MADDPLSMFRRRVQPKPAPAAKPQPSLVVNRPGDREPYESFGTKDKVQRLDVRCGRRGNWIAHALPYNYLLNVSYNRRTFAEMFLTVSGLTIVIKGRWLRPVVDAIKLHTCDFIQEYDPEEFAEPSDPEAAFIESIAVEVMRGPSQLMKKDENA